MKKFRKVLATGMIAMMCLTACGSSASGSGSAANAPAGSASTAKGSSAYDICYVSTVEDEWLSELLKDMSVSAENNDVALEVKHAGNDSSKVIQCIEQAKAEGKEATIVNVAYSSDVTACVEAAGDMNLVFVNRLPEPDDYNLLGGTIAGVASDENLAGTFQGEFLADYFKEKGQTDVRYLLIQGPLDLSHSVIRSEKPLEILKDAGLNMVEVATISADYDRAKAQQGVESFLETGKEFDCIISNNDAMALGAIKALENKGIDPASIPIVGIDATADAVEAIQNGTMSMSVFQSAAGQAEAAIRIAKNLIDGKPAGEGTGCTVSDECDSLFYVPFEKVTSENVNDYAK